MKPTIKINEQDIIKRGYCTKEEYEVIGKESGRQFRVQTEEKDERFWGYTLKGQENLFILANTPVNFFGCPRPVCAMVGWHNNGVMDHAKSIELFTKAGKAAIDYYHNQFTKAKA